MSSITLDTKAALLALLKGDDALSQLLIGREDGEPGIIREGSRNQITKPVYPLITFRLPDQRPDARFKPTPAEGHGESPIAETILEMECWSQQATSVQVEMIADRVVALLEEDRIPFLSPSTGAIYQAICTMRSSSLPDPGTKSFYTLLRFRLRIHKG